MSPKPPSPELKIREEDLEPLLNRLESNALTPEDKQLVKNAFHFLIWLQKRYEAGRLTIHNLLKF